MAEVYLHAGGPLHGKLSAIPGGRATYVWATPEPIDMAKVFDPREDENFSMGYSQVTYERINVDLFGKRLSVYVLSGSGSDKADRLFDVISSSVVKAAMQ